MTGHKKARITVNDISIDGINVWRDRNCGDRSKQYVYRETLTNAEIASIVTKICGSPCLLNAGASEIVCKSDVLQGSFDGDLSIRFPIAKKGRLVSSDGKLKTIPDVYSVHVRGVFSPIIVVWIAERYDRKRAIEFEIEDLNPTDDCIRYMGDEVFPDYLTDIGEDSVTLEQVKQFMSTY